MEAEGVHPPGILERALALDPLDASIWIRAGLKAELAGDYTRAEEALLQAARVSRHLEPRSALVNFYFRRGQESLFWEWFARSLERVHGDPGQLFTLAWAMRPDPLLILGRLEPAGSKVLRQYLDFLMNTGRFEAAGDAAARLASAAGAEDRAVLVNYVTRAIDAGLPAPALAVWNMLCRSRLVPCEPLDPQNPITNGQFARASENAGFDWRTWLVDGAAVSQRLSPGMLRIDFSGRQPERCDLIWQLVPVKPSTRYRLVFEHESNGLPAPSGLRWRATDFPSGAEIAVDTPELASDSRKTSAAGFETPPGCRFARLLFRYDRAPGTSRGAGEFLLRAFRLEERR